MSLIIKDYSDNIILHRLKIKDFETYRGECLSEIRLTYEVFGRAMHTAPVVLVNHALTGNSSVSGDNGWWNALIGKNKCIDTEKYTVLCFNIPGNGYRAEGNTFTDYKTLNTRDAARIFSKGLDLLNIQKIHAVIGGSLGGGIAWELAVLRPRGFDHVIPIASDWKSTDWLKANCMVQEKILLHSENPIEDARIHAMMLYRSPQSFKMKFDRKFNESKNIYEIESWLLHHGKKLQKRFSLEAYKALNHMLANIDITRNRGDFEQVVDKISATVHLISVDSDLFFTLEEDQNTYQTLKKLKKKVTHGVIESPHGHDAFLIEFEQLTDLLKAIF